MKFMNCIIFQYIIFQLMNKNNLSTFSINATMHAGIWKFVPNFI